MFALERSLRLLLATVAASTVLALPGLSKTWVVDDTFGTGADFGEIKAALAAASPGDTIVVKPGVYQPFTVFQPIKIVAETGVYADHYQVNGVLGKVSIAGVDARHLLVIDCLGTVVIDGARIRFGQAPGSVDAVYVKSSADVRFVDCVLRGFAGTSSEPDAGGGLEVSASRVELTSCSVRGGDGAETECEWGGIPGAGVRIKAGSTFHAARSSMRGGRGGDATAGFCAPPFAADGGHGLDSKWNGAGLQNTVILAGLATDEIQGGDGGKGETWNECGWGGDGVHMGAGALRRSGVTPIRGAAGCPAGIEGDAVYLSPDASQVVAAPADPTLERLNDPVRGAPVTLQVNGAPGAAVTLYLSRTPKVVNTPGVVGDLLLAKMRVYDLGVLPASGAVTKNIQLPAGWPVGMLILGQAECTYPGGEVRRTNSVPLVLR